MIKAGQSPYDAAVIVQAKYSSLKSLLSVNGYRLDTTTDLSLINQPRRYQYNSENEGQLFYDALYAQKQGELKTYVWSDKSGGDIIQVTKVNEGAKMSYDEWLQQKKSELAKILKKY
jgi:hypothetical protein